MTAIEPADENALAQLNTVHNVPPKECVKQSTVLPSPIASIISLATATLSFGLRLGGFFANAGLQCGRVSTLTSFELGRVVLEGVLLRAGQDVVDTSVGPLGRVAAEGLLESALATLHYSLTHTSFLVSTGFQIGSTSVASSLALSQYLLSAIDAVLGDTETSKAVATVIVLIRREFQNPDTGIPGEKVGLGDLIVGAVAFALLQRWGKERTNEEFLESGGEETIWNIVVLNEDIARLEIQNSSDDDASPGEEEIEDHQRLKRIRRASSVSGVESLDVFANDDQASMISNVSSHPFAWGNDETRSEQAFRSYLTKQLPQGTSVSVTAQSVTTNTITVELTGGHPANLEPPPGYHVVAYDDHAGPDGQSKKVILQKRRKKVRRGSFDVDDPVAQLSHTSAKHLSWTTFHPSDTLEQTAKVEISSITPVEDEQLRPESRVGHIERRPPTPAADPPKGNVNSSPSMIPISSTYLKEKKQPSASPPSKPPLANQKRQRVPPGLNPKTPERTEKKSTLKSSLRRGTSYKNLVEFWNGDKRGSRGHPPRPTEGSNQQTLATKPSSADTLPSFSFPAGSDVKVDDMVGVTSEMQDRPTQEDTLASAPDKSTNLQLLVRSDSSVSQRAARHGHQPSLTEPTYSPSLKRWKDAQRSHSRPSSRRSRASFYTLPAANSETSLVLHNRGTRQEVARCLYRDGSFPGVFPRHHFLKNLSRFSRFASAAYGTAFLRFIGAISDDDPLPPPNGVYQLSQHHSFSAYTRLPSSTVLLSSFVDPQGGFDAKGNTDTGMPLVHYIVLDHESKAVVLTCRGTLGFEDVLTDMICDYDDIVFCGKTYQVHKGIHASARRLLTIHGGRNLATIKAALEEFEDYGLVLCGHSLGGGVATLLSLYLAQPNPVDPHTSAFVTVSRAHSNFSLPPNRPIHVYTYGPPSTISPYLRRATRGLITTVVNGQDLVPYLSIGTLRDFQAVALAFKVDTNDAKGEVKRRVWEGLKTSFRDKTGLSAFGGLSGGPWNAEMQRDLEEDEDPWPWVALRSLRAGMLSEKLCPPGEVFVLETQPVLQRHAFVEASGLKAAAAAAAASAASSALPSSFKPANRATLTIVHDPERRFGELRFGAGMFADHSPARYEKALKLLERGVCGIDV